MKTCYVYILASKKNGAIYIGMTSDLTGRVWQHRHGIFSGHTKKYHIRRLVWFADFPDPDSAIAYEKKLKRWRRAWKDELIARENPDWRDRYDELISV